MKARKARKARLPEKLVPMSFDPDLNAPIGAVTTTQKVVNSLIDYVGELQEELVKQAELAVRIAEDAHDHLHALHRVSRHPEPRGEWRCIEPDGHRHGESCLRRMREFVSPQPDFSVGDTGNCCYCGAKMIYVWREEKPDASS